MIAPLLFGYRQKCFLSFKWAWSQRHFRPESLSYLYAWFVKTFWRQT